MKRRAVHSKKGGALSQPLLDKGSESASVELSDLYPNKPAEVEAYEDGTVSLNDDRNEDLWTQLSTAPDFSMEDLGRTIRADGSNKKKVFGIEFGMFLAFVVCFAIATAFERGNADAFYLVDRMKHNLFFKEIANSRLFEDIVSISDIWRFVLNPGIVVHFLWRTHYDNNELIPEPDRFYLNQHNKLLGGVRFRQLRVRPWSCPLPSKYKGHGLSQCYGAFTTGNQEKAPFGGPNGDRYTWTSASENAEPTWYGKLGVYPGSGYVTDLPLNRTLAVAKLEQMRADGWVDYSTRVVFIDFQTYNAGANLHFFGRMAFEMPDTGGVRPKADFLALKVNRYFGTKGQAQLAMEILLIVFVCYFIAEEVRDMRKKGRRYIRQGWIIVDWLILVTFFTILGVRVASYVRIAERDPVQHEHKYESLRTVVEYMEIENLLTSGLAFLIWVKLFKFFRWSKRLDFLFRTFRFAAVDLFFFTVVFFIFFLAFAHGGYIAFSADTIDFRSFGISVITLFKAVTGDMDYEDLSRSNRIFGPVYFLVFQVCVLLILINVFLAILADAYSAIRKEDESKKSEAIEELRMLNPLAGVVGKVKDIFKRGDKGVTEEDGGSAANAMKEAEKVFSRLDTDADGQLDEQELSQFVVRAPSLSVHSPANASSSGDTTRSDVAQGDLAERMQRIESMLDQLVKGQQR